MQDERAAVPCPSCGATIESRYCSECGEQRTSHHDLSLAHFVEEALHGFTHFEGKALRTLRGVFVPGLLTSEYLRGARTRWARPVALFLLVNLVYFIVQPLTIANTFNTTLSLHIERQAYSQWVKPLVEARIASRGIALDAYAREFDLHAGSFSKLLLILLAPAFAPFLALTRRGGRSKPFGEHVVLALHFWTFQLLAICVLAMLSLRVLLQVQLAFGVERIWMPDEFETGCATLALQAWWLAFALRRVDGVSMLDALWRGACAALCASALFVPYRFLTFWVVYWTT